MGVTLGSHCLLLPSRFHDVEPLQGLSMMPPSKVSKAVVLGGSRRVPWPRLGENTLLLADELVVTQAADGRWFLVVRYARLLAVIPWTIDSLGAFFYSICSSVARAVVVCNMLIA
eukprot:GHUV01051075.1.p1 GENE.GHUV01051075.1~~GHUV01051075.1.p1  ORF type:complete len:115 (+),score=2.05 GHUV01051075.1:131-475(+)